jgi:hypothetical protein
VEIELVPDPGSGDPSAHAALVALTEAMRGGREGDAAWGLVPHSGAWWREAVSEAVGRSEGFGAGAGPGARKP